MRGMVDVLRYFKDKITQIEIFTIAVCLHQVKFDD